MLFIFPMHLHLHKLSTQNKARNSYSPSISAPPLAANSLSSPPLSNASTIPSHSSCKSPLTNGSPCQPIPISRIPHITLLPVQIGMHPRAIRTLNILRHLMRPLPVALAIPPKRQQRPIKLPCLRRLETPQSSSQLAFLLRSRQFQGAAYPRSRIHFDNQIRPHAQLRIRRRQSSPMRPMLKQMQLRRNPRLHQRRIKHHAVHHRHRLDHRSSQIKTSAEYPSSPATQPRATAPAQDQDHPPTDSSSTPMHDTAASNVITG